MHLTNKAYWQTFNATLPAGLTRNGTKKSCLQVTDALQSRETDLFCGVVHG